MDKPGVDELINKGLELLEHKKGLSAFELEKKASTLLVLTASLSQVRLELEVERIKALSTERAVSSFTISRSVGKTVTEKKLEADVNQDYVNAREELETLEANITYIKSMMEIFTNGHIFVRQMLRNDM